MSQENVEIIEQARRLYAAYNRLDWDGFFALTDPDFEFDPTEAGGVVRGRKAMAELTEDWFSTWEEWQWEPGDRAHSNGRADVRRPSKLGQEQGERRHHRGALLPRH